ncbi:DUF4214 domain-containing protein [Mesorhizobium sp. CAU 1741]|uniref:DUF4214 domain-containing protein n=1 Tax=Mesorhizobium sp. CAU 1741 TaxID=3140366 RepID=UPI00325B8321
MPLGNLLDGVGNLVDGVGDTVEGLVDPLLPGVGSTSDDVVDALANLLRGTNGSSPLGNLFSNGLLGEDPTQSILGLNLLDDEGVVVLDVLGTEVAVLPDNGGIVTIDDQGVLGESDVLDLGGLLGDGGLLDLSGLLGSDSLLDLSGLLGGVLGLLSPDGSLDPDDYLDEDGNVDTSKFETVLIGTDGRDTFSITEDSSTYVDGRGGLDVVNLGRSVEGLSFASGSNAVVFADGDTPYYFENVERVTFFEGALYLDTGAGENAGIGYRLYQAAFNRTPDNDGVKFWVEELDEGLSAQDAAAGFIFSNEFAATYGSLSDEEFVAEIYENVLGRSAEGAGTDYWLGELDSGRQDRADVLLGFSESAENVELVGQVIDDGYTVA